MSQNFECKIVIVTKTNGLNLFSRIMIYSYDTIEFLMFGLRKIVVERQKCPPARNRKFWLRLYSYTYPRYFKYTLSFLSLSVTTRTIVQFFGIVFFLPSCNTRAFGSLVVQLY